MEIAKLLLLRLLSYVCMSNVRGPQTIKKKEEERIDS